MSSSPYTRLVRFLEKRHRTALPSDLADAIIDACQKAVTLYETTL